MTDRKKELIEALQALSQVQGNKQTFVNTEIQAVIKELMKELKIQQKN